MALVMTSGPAVEPLSTAEARAHCRVDIADDDTLLARLITTARQYVETISRPQRALIHQTWKLVLDDWPTSPFALPVVPLASVTAIEYTTAAGVTATFASANYLVDAYSEPGRVVLKTTGAGWPGATLQELNGVTITFIAGHGASSAAVPEAYRQAMLLLIGHWYENREAQMISGAVPKELDFAVRALLAPYRMEVR